MAIFAFALGIWDLQQGPAIASLTSTSAIVSFALPKYWIDRVADASSDETTLPYALHDVSPQDWLDIWASTAQEQRWANEVKHDLGNSSSSAGSVLS